MIDRVVGTYKILAKVGEGGMGSVYRGIDLMLDRPVAIKVLRPELTRNSQLVERFRKEAVTLAKLNHPAIAGVYTFFREADEFFLVMEFAEGRSLDKVLSADGAFDARTAVRLFDTVLDGVSAAHRIGVIHRDIKPENIMVSPAGEMKIMDFGIAWVVGQARMTRTGAVVGTLHYMSPEQVRGSDPGTASDIYALGVLLYEMITGQLPLDADSDFELMKAHLERDPDPPSKIVPDLPVWLTAAVVRALAKNPDDRFHDAGAFRDHLLRGAADQWPDGVSSENNESAAAVSDPAEDAAAVDDHAGVKPTRLAATPPPLPPPTRLASPVQRPTRLAKAPAETAPAGIRQWVARAIGQWHGLEPPARFLAGASAVTAVILAALVAVLIRGPRETAPAPLVILDPTPRVLEQSPGEAVATEPSKAPAVPLDPTSPPTVTTPFRREETRPKGRDQPKPAATRPAPRPVDPPRRTVSAAPTEVPDRSAADSGDPRDSAPTMAEARSLVGAVERGTDRLTASFRSYLKALGKWRPSGDNESLWEEIKALERATDKLSLYVRKHIGMSKLRKKKHPSGWTRDEYAEVRSQVRDVTGRIPHIDGAIQTAQTNSEVRDNWQAVRSKIDHLSGRF